MMNLCGGYLNHYGDYSAANIERMSEFNGTVLLVIAGRLWLFSAFKAHQTKAITAISLLAFIVMFIAELIGRGVFYGLHFTVGII
ncbi:MAG: dimethyl sulfoxide reductase anchor subunit [Photobacterium aquimaris]|nr:dimethyl sulfoxide reductase anchor subunit [Photobacterium aquimaris]